MVKCYCVNCGEELERDVKFCADCGTPNRKASTKEKISDKKEKVKVESYDCPKCGGALSSIVTSCPYCNYEIKGRGVSKSVQELIDKLAKIDEREMIIETEKPSLMKAVIGVDFNNKTERETEKKAEFESKKINDKVTLITNWPVSNSKEDILEFMILIAANIKSDYFIDLFNKDEVEKAWIKKLNQVYRKAEIVMKHDPDFSEIQSIYERKQWRKKKNEPSSTSINRVWLTPNIIKAVLIGIAILALLDNFFRTTFIIVALLLAKEVIAKKKAK